MSAPALWYYHKEGRGFGPADDAEISRLIAREEIAADTLVWRDGLDNWTEAQSTELSRLLLNEAPSPPSRSLTQSRRTRARPGWALFCLTEILNVLIVGIFVFVFLARG